MNASRSERILLWSTCADRMESVEESLSRAGWVAIRANSETELCRAVLRGAADLVVLRICDRPEELHSLLAWIVEQASAPPVLLVADALDVWRYLDAMRRGAYDCVGMPVNDAELVRLVEKALESRSMASTA